MARKSQLEENPGEIVQQQLTSKYTNCYRLESGVYSSAGPPKTTDKAEDRGEKIFLLLTEFFCKYDMFKVKTHGSGPFSH